MSLVLMIMRWCLVGIEMMKKMLNTGLMVTCKSDKTCRSQGRLGSVHDSDGGDNDEDDVVGHGDNHLHV